jgi:hypothetical protein
MKTYNNFREKYPQSEIIIAIHDAGKIHQCFKTIQYLHFSF